jgi:hypothetical protein
MWTFMACAKVGHAAYAANRLRSLPIPLAVDEGMPILAAPE